MAISSAVDASAVARVVGIKTIFRDLRGGGILFLPQRLAVVGQGSSASTYDTTKRQVTSATEAATLYGFGSPIHLAVLQLLPVNGDGVGTIPVTVYPLEDDGSGVASAGISPRAEQLQKQQRTGFALITSTRNSSLSVWATVWRILLRRLLQRLTLL